MILLYMQGCIRMWVLMLMLKFGDITKKFCLLELLVLLEACLLINLSKEDAEICS